jgi:tetratricopeptide (TPR) repeat protein
MDNVLFLKKRQNSWQTTAKGLEEMKSYAIRLRREREQRSWSQKELAEKVNTTAPNVSRWERGITFPGPYFRQRLCELYQKTPQDLGFLLENTDDNDELENALSDPNPPSLTSIPNISVPLWNIQVRRNPFFTGREEILARLHDTLQSGKAAALTQVQAITGLGGIGKTQTALEYAYRFKDDYQAIFWVRAETHDTLVIDIVHIAELLQLPEQNSQDQDYIVAGVKHWLGSHADWLLILDNVEDVSRVEDFTPTQFAGHLLLTTRSQTTGAFAHRIDLEQMEPHEGTLFLLRRAKLIEIDEKLEDIPVSIRNAAYAIYQNLGGLPLALDQAGAYIEETGGSLADYIELFQTQQAALLALRGNSHSDHPHSVAATVSLSLARIEQVNPAAANLLRLCSFLYPDGIPEEIFTAEEAVLGPALQQIAGNRLRLDIAIADLRKYSFLRRNADSRYLIIHRLVQTVIKESMDNNKRRQWAEWAMIAVNAVFPEPEHDAWPQCERLLSQAFAAIQLVNQYQFVTEESGRLLYETAYYLREHARYTEAVSLIQQSLQIREQVFGLDHLQVSYPLNGLGSLYRQLGRYAEAKVCYQRALQIREKQLEPDHALVAFPLYNLAQLYREQGMFAEAEPLYQRALQIREQQLGPDHSLVTISLNGLAVLYSEQSKYAEAEHIYQLVLQIRMQQLGPDHPLTATCLNNLALLAYKRGNFTEAEPLFKRALAIWMQRMGPDHPLVAHPLHGLANLHREHGNFAEAESLFQQALHIREQSIGSEHPETAETIYDIAQLREAQGNYREAKINYAHALAIYQQRLGPNHPLAAETRNHLISLLHTMNQHEEAARLEISGMSVSSKL